MGTTLKDLKFLLERVLHCELEEGRRHTQYYKDNKKLSTV